jgi:cell wall assembly regulator SMI1
MTEPDEFGKAIQLLTRVPRPPDAQPCSGASSEQLSVLENLLGYSMPEPLRTWLTLCNGVIAGPGGLYGSKTTDDFLDIAFVLRMYPSWRERKWLPIAGDGNGNHYVIDASHTHLDTDGVFFVDVSEDPLELAYVVASGLPQFLVFLLEREVGVIQWPFDRDFVLARDSAISSVTPPRLLPWN